eukprot:Polyplicarium_translucidae@DN1799_c0_g1_i1.p1
MMSPAFHAASTRVDHRLPMTSEILEEYNVCPAPELRETSVAVDGLRYSLRTGKLYIPPKFRAALLYWFHYGKYGGHHGVNRTRRRTSRYCWWPGLPKDVKEYIGSCLPCTRYRPANLKSLRGLLTKPTLFQMISLDCVGPRDWHGEKKWILVTVDHCTRYMITKALHSPPTGETTVMFLKEHWLPYFGSCEAVLVDRGSEFIETSVRRFVVQEMQANLVFTSPSYPQGNAVNESSHRLLEHTIKCRSSTEIQSDFTELVRDATMVYNSVPHGSTGQPPFFLVTGQDMMLPGMARLSPQLPDDVRKSNLRMVRINAMVRSLVRPEQYENESTAKLAPGDVVLHKLTEYERAHHAGHPQSASAKYSPLYSRPCRVVRVDHHVAQLQDLWSPGSSVRQAPLTQLRKFSCELPPALARVAISEIELEKPRFPQKSATAWSSYGTPMYSALI